MAKLVILVVILLVLVAVGGGLYLAFGNFPAPTTRVETVLPNAQFPK